MLILFLLFILFILFSVVLTWFDIKSFILPDILTLSLLWIGVIINLNNYFCSISDAIFGVVIGYLILYLIYWIYFFITKKEGLGRGDIKLFAALGAWFGVYNLPLLLVISSSLGLILFLILFIFVNLKYTLKCTINFKDHELTKIPFGPCILLSGNIMIAQILSQHIL